MDCLSSMDCTFSMFSMDCIFPAEKPASAECVFSMSSDMKLVFTAVWMPDINFSSIRGRAPPSGLDLVDRFLISSL